VARYRNEEEALIGLARQLADACREAGTEVDEEYAVDAINDFLRDNDEHAPAEALIALLDMPMSKRTWPLLDSVEETLIGRGWEVVEPLLAAAQGRVYDHAGPVPQRARETLSGLSVARLIFGLVDVLRGKADNDLKHAAVTCLVALGDAAEPALLEALDHPVARRWAQDALGDLRAAREETKLTEDLERAASGEDRVGGRRRDE
jgi:HEAT repeat protein